MGKIQGKFRDDGSPTGSGLWGGEPAEDSALRVAGFGAIWRGQLDRAMGLFTRIAELIRGRRQKQAEITKRAYLLSLYMGEANGIEGPDRAFRPNRQRRHGKGAKGQDNA